MSYAFRRALAPDLPPLNEWVARSHVAGWWADAFDQEDLDDPHTRAWIVHRDGRPFAYLQDYPVHGAAPHPLDFLPAGARGTDQFIGDPAMVGVGHGSAMLRRFAAGLFAEGVPAVGVDPHPDNARAIAAYRRAGFVSDRPAVDTPWGRVLPMELWPR